MFTISPLKTLKRQVLGFNAWLEACFAVGFLAVGEDLGVT
jgi:hypothetical protein